MTLTNQKRPFLKNRIIEAFPKVKVKDLLIRNRRFLEAVADEMIDEGVLLHSDIQRIRDEVGVTEVAA